MLIFASIRRALVRWGFNTKQRADPPADVAEVLAWVARNSASVSALAEPATARRVLDQATDRVDGKPAAASTARRHRIILANAMDYAVELGLLDTNPIRVLKWTAPKVYPARDHLAQFGTAPGGRLFGGVRVGGLPTITYRRAWAKARQVALTAAEQVSPLARRPYDRRHACLSTWLNGGVYPTQVAGWAGHSVDVLLRIYAKCVVGQD